VEDPELSQYRRTVVVDFFSGQPIICVKRVHTAKWNFNPSPCRRKATPRAEVRTVNYDFNQNGIVCDMSVLYLYLYVRQRPHQLFVKQADSIRAFIVFAPCLVIVSRTIAEGAENTFKVMPVLEANVFLNNCNTRQLPVVVSRNGCACHMHLRSRFMVVGEDLSQQILSAGGGTNISIRQGLHLEGRDM
jgi:hypothetical protein